MGAFAVRKLLLRYV